MRRDNNFDILRLLFAWIVVLTHCSDLSLSPAFLPYHFLLQSQRAVEGFYAISGCLIVASWDRSRSKADYFRRRAKRILPAYWFALIFCLAIGGAMSSLPPRAFWGSADIWKYLGANLLFLNFLHPNLPGVFTSNPTTNVMNGALWTIKNEVAFYFLVPFLVWLVRKFGAWRVLSAVFFASLILRETMFYTRHYTIMEQLPCQLPFFMVGAAVYYFFPQFEAHRTAMWTVALLLMAGIPFNQEPLDAFAVPLFVMCIAFLLPPYRGVTRHGDFSYGTYVLHFPVIQTLVAFGLFARSPWIALCVVLALIIPLSLVSWFGVERHFLRPARVRQQEHEVVANVL